MGLWRSYRLRLERRRLLIRAFRKRRELRSVVDRSQLIKPTDVLLFSTIRNEKIRLEYFLKYYRRLGVDHFMIVDNDSDDGSRDYLAGQKDVSVWTTDKSYNRSRFGVDWLNYLLMAYGHGHWTLVVDPDEFFVYPFSDTRNLHALTDWLEGASIDSFSAMILDMYPKGPIDARVYQSGQNPFEHANWFDSGNYSLEVNPKYENLWIQGGPRSRHYFTENPRAAPALNKIPLVKWDRRYSYVSSTHSLLPRRLNKVYDEWGGEKASGCLMHAKFLHTFLSKSIEEAGRKQHYAKGDEYRAYHSKDATGPDFWNKSSVQYINWRQLEILGLMSKGNWA